jgi:hypothetical protein
MHEEFNHKVEEVEKVEEGRERMGRDKVGKPKLRVTLCAFVVKILRILWFPGTFRVNAGALQRQDSQGGGFAWRGLETFLR